MLYFLRLFLFITCSFIATTPLFSFDVRVLEFDLGYNWRSDNFHWESETPQTVPIVTSNFHYEEIQSNGIQGRMKIVSDDHIYIRGMLDYGWISNGRGRGLIENDSLLITEYECHAHRGNVWDVDFAVGYQLNLHCNTVRVTPLIGFSSQQQRIHFDDFDLVVEGGIPLDPSLEVDGFKQTFRSKWNGFLVGADLEIDLCYLVFLGSFEYHQACFGAQFNQNANTLLGIDDPLKAHIEGCGRGFLGSFGFSYETCESWVLSLLGTYQYWTVEEASFRQHVEDSDERTLADFHLRWNSWSITALIGYSF